MMQSGASSNIPDINVFNAASINEIDRPLVPDMLIEEFFFFDYGDRSLAVPLEVSVLIANLCSAPGQDLVPRGPGTSPLPQHAAIDVIPGHRRNIIDPGSGGGVWVAALSERDFNPMKIDTSAVGFPPDAASVILEKSADAHDGGVNDLLLQ